MCRPALGSIGAILAILFFLTPSSSRCQSGNPIQEALVATHVDWHLAGLAEIENRWQDARAAYERIYEDVVPLPLNVREWYRATAAYGKALCAARLSDCPTAEKEIGFAIEHHLWNFNLFQVDSSILMRCGSRWFDSVKSFWTNVRTSEQHGWSGQPTRIIYPEDYRGGAELPIVIALHGGNACYEEFTEYWQPVATKLHLAVLVPPGVIRESETTNSWGSDMRPVEASIMQLIQTIRTNHLGDTNQIFLAGYSQGGRASIEIGLKHPEIVRGIVSICGFVEDTLDSISLRHAAQSGEKVYAISASLESDGFRNSIESESKRCVQFGIPFRTVTLGETIHEMPLDFTTQFERAWQWLHERITVGADPDSVQRRRHSSE